MQRKREPKFCPECGSEDPARPHAVLIEGRRKRCKWRPRPEAPLETTEERWGPAVRLVSRRHR